MPALVGGYLLQFGVFMLVALKTQHANNFPGWLIASLLACAALVIGYSWWRYRFGVRTRSLQRNGVHARGVVVKVVKPVMNVVVHNVSHPPHAAAANAPTESRRMRQSTRASL